MPADGALPMAELRLPARDWQSIAGMVVVDPDGWREPDAPLPDDPITFDEFQRRANASTVAPIDSPAARPAPGFELPAEPTEASRRAGRDLLTQAFMDTPPATAPRGGVQYDRGQPSQPASEPDRRPHSRACGFRRHDHGPECSADCPTCGAGRLLPGPTEPPASFRERWEASVAPVAELRAHVESIVLGPGELLVLQLGHPVESADIEAVRAAVAATGLTGRVLVLDPSVTVRVVRAGRPAPADIDPAGPGTGRPAPAEPGSSRRPAELQLPGSSLGVDSAHTEPGTRS